MYCIIELKRKQISNSNIFSFNNGSNFFNKHRCKNLKYTFVL